MRNSLFLCYNVDSISCMESRTMLSLTADFGSNDNSDPGSNDIKQTRRNRTKIPWGSYVSRRRNFQSYMTFSGLRMIFLRTLQLHNWSLYTSGV